MTNMLAVMSVLLYVAIAYMGVRAWRWEAGGLVILSAEHEDVLVKERMKISLEQYRSSFRLVIAAGATALFFWAIAVAMLLLDLELSVGAATVELIGAAGGSALFGYFLRVWRECRRNARQESGS